MRTPCPGHGCAASHKKSIALAADSMVKVGVVCIPLDGSVSQPSAFMDALTKATLVVPPEFETAETYLVMRLSAIITRCAVHLTVSPEFVCNQSQR